MMRGLLRWSSRVKSSASFATSARFSQQRNFLPAASPRFFYNADATRYFSANNAGAHQMTNPMMKELAFLKTAENLKKELRHSWLSDGRRESVAEHSWRLGLMAYRYAGRLDQPVSVEKCLKLALVHDLAEAKVGDIPVFNCQTEDSKRNKFLREKAAMDEIKNSLGDKQGNELHEVWVEYEAQETYESKFIKALDKLEVFIQHNEAELSTWEENERRMIFQHKWLRKHCEFDSFLNNLCTAVIDQAIDKLKRAGEDVEQIRQAAEEEERNGFKPMPNKTTVSMCTIL